MSMIQSLPALLFALLLTGAATPAVAQPPALPTANTAEFFIDEGGTPSGPLSMEQLRQRAASGTLTATTLAWTEGMPGWQPAAQVMALSGLFAPTAAAATTFHTSDPKGFLTGRWQVQGQLPMGEQGLVDGEIQMTYSPDGSFTMNGVYRLPHPQAGVIPLQTSMNGSWRVNGVDPQGSIALFLNGDMVMEAPAQFNIPRQTETMIQDDALQVLDANTVVDGSGLTWRRL